MRIQYKRITLNLLQNSSWYLQQNMLLEMIKLYQLYLSKDSGRFSSSKVDTLAVVLFIEVLYLVKYAIFRVNKGLYTLISSDTLLFYQFFHEEERLVVQPVVLVILIVIDSHLHKTVLHPGENVCIKEKSVLLDQLVVAIIRYLDLKLGLIADMILNQNNSNNNIIDPTLDIEIMQKFQDSKRGWQIN